MSDMIRAFTVTADPQTGEWLDDLAETAPVVRTDFLAQPDTDAEHFDTFEHEDETCAITVRWG